MGDTYRSTIMNILDLPDVIIRLITKSLYSMDDRLSLALTCKSFRAQVMPAIYSNILIADYKVRQVFIPTYEETPYTICTLERLPLLVRSINTDSPITQYIRRIYVDCNFDFSRMHDMQKLIEVLLDWKDTHANYPMEYLKSINFLKHDFGVVELMKTFSSSYATDPCMLYENDDFDSYYEHFEKSSNRKTLPSLESYQLRNMDEVFLLPSLSRLRLQVNLEQSNLYDRTISLQKLSRHVSKQYITSLEFVNQSSLISFFSTLTKDSAILKENTNLLPNLKRLSITISDIGYFSYLPKVIDCLSLEDVELRLSKFSILPEDEFKNIDALDFINTLLHPDVQRLSLVNLNPNNLFENNSIASETVFDDSNLLYYITKYADLFSSNQAAENIKYLLFSLNNFFHVPQLYMHGINNGYADPFTINTDYVEKKVELFKKFLKFPNIKTLVIPDYLFNWKPFLAFDDEIRANESIGDMYNIFNKCTCPDCQKVLAEIPQGKNGNELLYTYYNIASRELFQRMPKLQNTFGMNFFDIPFRESSTHSSFACPTALIKEMQTFLLHNMKHDLLTLSKMFPHLETLCLGGYLFFVRQLSDSTQVFEPYEKRSFVF